MMIFSLRGMLFIRQVKQELSLSVIYERYIIGDYTMRFDEHLRSKIIEAIIDHEETQTLNTVICFLPRDS